MKMMTVDQSLFFNRAVRMAFHGDCDVDWFRKKRDEDYRWGVNWSCCGTQDIATTEDFMVLMGNAIALAEEMNAIEISGEIDYEAPDAYHISDEKTYNETLNTVAHLIRMGWAKEACSIMFK